jgi:hypothetical protein
MLKKLKKLSKISIELALRDTSSAIGVFENEPYLELDFTHQSGLRILINLNTDSGRT